MNAINGNTFLQYYHILLTECFNGQVYGEEGVVHSATDMTLSCTLWRENRIGHP